MGAYSAQYQKNKKKTKQNKIIRLNVHLPRWQAHYVNKEEASSVRKELLGFFLCNFRSLPCMNRTTKSKLYAQHSLYVLGLPKYILYTLDFQLFFLLLFFYSYRFLFFIFFPFHFYFLFLFFPLNSFD